jgi:hypothetical protein
MTIRRGGGDMEIGQAYVINMPESKEALRRFTK